MKHAWQVLAATALAMSLSVPAIAQQSRVFREGNGWVEETTGSLPDSKNLSIRLETGNLTVQGGGQRGISYTVRKRVTTGNEAVARHQFEIMRFSASRSGESAVLTGDVQGRISRASMDLTVEVPRAIESVQAQTEGGNESVTGLAGRVDLTTSGGNINLDDIGGVVNASSGGGNVNVGNVGSDVLLKTGGGNIVVGSAKGRIVTKSGGGNITVGSGAQAMSVKTGGGTIDVQRCGGELKAQTGGGNIHLASATGPVSVQTGGGSVELMNLSQGAKVETGGGGITAEFLGNGGFTGADLQTPAGDVVVYLGNDLKATIKASVDIANSHGIRSEFPDIHVTSEGGQWGPKSYFAEGNLNGGGPVVRLHTSTGDIVIRRAKK